MDSSFGWERGRWIICPAVLDSFSVNVMGDIYTTYIYDLCCQEKIIRWIGDRLFGFLWFNSQLAMVEPGKDRNRNYVIDIYYYVDSSVRTTLGWCIWKNVNFPITISMGSNLISFKKGFIKNVKTILFYEACSSSWFTKTGQFSQFLGIFLFFNELDQCIAWFRSNLGGPTSPVHFNKHQLWVYNHSFLWSMQFKLIH